MEYISDLRNSDEKNIKFSFLLTDINNLFFKRIIYTNIVEGNLKYTLTSAFYEGLEILQKKNINITQETNLPIRFNKKGRGKGTENVKNFIITSVVTKPSIKEWIENFIYHRMKKNNTYSKRELIDEIVEVLKKKYSSNILEIPLACK